MILNNKGNEIDVYFLYIIVNDFGTSQIKNDMFRFSIIILVQYFGNF